jgi:CRISPR/Cas system-associated endonuclease Cas1
MTTYNPEEIKHLKYIWGTWNTLQFACSSKEIMWNWDFGRRAFFLTYKDKKNHGISYFYRDVYEFCRFSSVDINLLILR